jgi:hypothetical protein
VTKWTLRQAYFCLIGSTCVTCAAFCAGLFLWQKKKAERLLDKGYLISAIVQTGPEKEALPTSYLAEVLELSVDNPTNLFAFHLKQGEEKLHKAPCIAKAEIKRLAPNALYIDYEVRKPIASLGDYQNIAIDQEGFLFPIAPFFSPKELPEIYLGLPAFGCGEDSFGRKGGAWQVPLRNAHLDLAIEILQFLQGSPWRDGLRVKRIDVSSAFSPSLGSREIVLFTEEDLILYQGQEAICCTFPKTLRLSPKEYMQQMNNFFALRKNILDDYRKQMASATIPPTGRFASRIVDLRIPHLAFVEN